ncbi:MAG TPA: hypothetical protein VFT82_01925 [Candidatus Paceibacterota bacterium]|nr:hypothetical protein [Candidatus Paceibacterota bacterium]
MFRRFFSNKTSLLAILPLIALFFAVPHEAHAFIGSLVDFSVDAISHLLASTLEIFVLPLASALLALAGMLMDTAIQFSLHTAYIVSLSPAVNLGWSIVRDIANLFFIFVLIYISLKTILSGSGFSTMSMLKSVIIAAILINFSLFFAKAIVDVSNVFGNWLYNGVNATLQANSSTGSKPSLSDLISERLGIIQWWKLGLTDTTANASAGNYWSDPSKGFIGAILRLSVVLTAIYIFIYIAVLFIARAVTILFLLVFAPIGFMGKVLPQVGKYSSEWWKNLSDAGTFPIAFLLMLYISLQFINSLGMLSVNLVNDKTLIGGVSVTQYFQYFLIIFLLRSSLGVAKGYSGEIGELFGGFADALGKMAVNAVSTYATGGMSMALRAGGRGLGAAISKEGNLSDRWAAFKDEGTKNLPPILTSPKLGKYIKEAYKDPMKLAHDALDMTTDKMKSGTWDVRNVGIGGTTAGSLLTDSVNMGTKAKFDMKGKTEKEIKAEQGEWAEERKIEKANEVILSQIRDIELAKENFDKNHNQAAYDAAIKTAKDKMALETQKLGSRELEKLDKGALKNDHFLQSISEGHASYLADKAETDAAKTKIWGARLSDVTDAVKNSGNVKAAIKNHSDEELKNLPPEILADPAFVNPDNMDYDKFNSLTKSKNIVGATKEKMREARYSSVYTTAQKGDANAIKASVSKMKAHEISKLGEKFFKDGAGVNMRAIDAIVSRGNTDVFEKMIQNDEDDATRGLIRTYVSGMAAASGGNYQKVADWMNGGRGSAF